jgi:hypothetical protein
MDTPTPKKGDKDKVVSATKAKEKDKLAVATPTRKDGVKTPSTSPSKKMDRSFRSPSVEEMKEAPTSLSDEESDGSEISSDLP